MPLKKHDIKIRYRSERGYNISTSDSTPEEVARKVYWGLVDERFLDGKNKVTSIEVDGKIVMIDELFPRLG